MSAPTMPGVIAAMSSRSTSSSSGRLRVWTSRILRRPSLSGGGTVTRRSNRPGPQQRLVEDLRAVGRAEHDHRVPGLEPVHLREDLVERLLALVVAAAERVAGGAAAPDRVELVDEDDRRRGFLGLLEEVAHAGLAPMPTIASTNSDARDGEERHARLAGDRAGEQRLAGAGTAREQHAARNPAAQLLVLLRVLEEVDDLGELALGLVDARDVLEGHARVVALDAAGLRAPERADRAHLPARGRRLTATRTGTRAGSPGRTRGSGSSGTRARH